MYIGLIEVIMLHTCKMFNASNVIESLTSEPESTTPGASGVVPMNENEIRRLDLLAFYFNNDFT